MNNDEEKAFELIKFLLIDLNLREQYLPNMKDLQKHMYQMSRLINENCSDVYFHLENSEISTSLYAASWFLSNRIIIFIFHRINLKLMIIFQLYFHLIFKWALLQEYLISYFSREL